MKLAVVLGAFVKSNWQVKLPMLVVKSAKIPLVCPTAIRVDKPSTPVTAKRATIRRKYSKVIGNLSFKTSHSPCLRAVMPKTWSRRRAQAWLAHRVSESSPVSIS